jgi:hypothetical protein
VKNTPCIFCGATGANVKITREHTFSDWINEALPPEIVGPDISCERCILHGPQAGTVNTWPAKEVAGHKVRAVCTTCNNGWMSDLETAVGPLIEPMIKGDNASLTTDQQITVATWAGMKTAVFEYVWTDEPILVATDREIMATQNRPPANVQVRLAAVESNGYPLRAIGRGYEARVVGGILIWSQLGDFRHRCLATTSHRAAGSTAATTDRHSRLKLTVRDSVRDGVQSSRGSAGRREEPPGRSKYPPI